MSASYDPDNIFAKILRGEAPCVRVYEDDATFAFMDIMPRTPGHTLIIPKAPARNILDISPADLAELIPTVQRIAIAAKKRLKPRACRSCSSTRAPAARSCSICISTSCRAGKASRSSRRAVQWPTPAELQPIAEKIKAAL